MKKISLLILVTISATTLISSGCFSHRSMAEKIHKTEGKETKQGDDDADFAAREEITKTVQLAANASVGVFGINGSVDVTTSDTDKAEIYIVRLARNKDTFEKHKVKIDEDANELIIHGDRKNSSGIWDFITGNDDLRTRVTLKLPRKIRFDVSGINGRVNVGEIEGKVEATGINGKVVIAKAVGEVQLGGINGKVEAGIANLNKDGIGIHGVNGNVDLKFFDEANVNIEAHGMNGRVNAELPNVQVTEQKHNNYSAKIGNGGPEINVGGMNGNLTLLRAGQAAKVEKKAETAASPGAKSEVKGS